MGGVAGVAPALGVAGVAGAYGAAGVAGVPLAGAGLGYAADPINDGAAGAAPYVLGPYGGSQGAAPGYGYGYGGYSGVYGYGSALHGGQKVGYAGEADYATGPDHTNVGPSTYTTTHFKPHYGLKYGTARPAVGAYHCKDVINANGVATTKRFCVPVGYHGGYGWPYWHGYPGVGTGLWGWG